MCSPSCLTAPVSHPSASGGPCSRCLSKGRAAVSVRLSHEGSSASPVPSHYTSFLPKTKTNTKPSSVMMWQEGSAYLSPKTGVVAGYRGSEFAQSQQFFWKPTKRPEAWGALTLQVASVLRSRTQQLIA